MASLFARSFWQKTLLLQSELLCCILCKFWYSSSNHFDEIVSTTVANKDPCSQGHAHAEIIGENIEMSVGLRGKPPGNFS